MCLPRYCIPIYNPACYTIYYMCYTLCAEPCILYAITYPLYAKGYDTCCYHLLGTTNYTHLFYVPSHPGELPKYTVRWGDGTQRLQTFNDKFDHIYRVGGVFNVTLDAHNAVSRNHSWVSLMKHYTLVV